MEMRLLLKNDNFYKQIYKASDFCDCATIFVHFSINLFEKQTSSGLYLFVSSTSKNF